MMKKIIVIATVLVMIMNLMPFASVSASETAEDTVYDITKTASITGFDAPKATDGVFVYTAEASDRVLDAKDYDFSSAYLLVFDENGMIYECGSNIYNGGPQQTVEIRKGGFLVASSSDSAVISIYTMAMEGAMLYNATMSVFYPIKAIADKENAKLTFCCNRKPSLPENTKRIMFVGNSTTYYNGGPLKLKYICKAAGIDVDIVYCTAGSAYLHEFADESHERGRRYRDCLKSQKIDYVIYQDAGLASEKQTDDALSVLVPLAREYGAEPMMYLRYSSGGSVSWDDLLYYSHGYYKTYTAMAKKYDMKLLPAGITFLYSYKEHPEINLYADDGVHHSGFASYMLACVWMYSMFGVSPAGNTCDIHYSDDIMRILWDCSVKAVEQGWNFSDSPDTASRNIGGTDYECISVGKAYTTTGTRYQSDNWEDINSDNELNYKLTDGDVAKTGDANSIGAVKGSDTEVVIDLGELKGIKQIETDLWGNSGWGIPDPQTATVTFSVSQNGKDFVNFATPDIADGDSSNWKKRLFTATSKECVNARYIKVRYQISGNFRWVSEILVFGGERSENDIQGGEASEPQTSDEAGVSDISDVNAEDLSKEPEDNSTDNGKTNATLFAVITAVVLAVITGGVLAFVKKRK